MRWRGIVVALILESVVLALACHAGDVRIAWDAPTNNTDGTALTNLGGYEIQRGQASRAYSWTSNVGKVTSTLVTGLTEGRAYWFAVRAYNTDGEYSDLSAELAWTAPDVTAPVIANPGNRLLWTQGAVQVPIPDLVAGLTVTDNVTPRAGLTVTQSPAAGTLKGVGTYPVTITARDAAGNTATTTVQVQVRRRQPNPPQNLRVQ